MIKPEDFRQQYDEYKKGIDLALEVFFDNELKLSPNQSSIGNIKRFCLAEGKRIRPIAVIAGYEACWGKDIDEIARAAISLEILHGYFLMHDDIMDQDPVRRGNPTLHIKYRDALVTMANAPEALARRGGENLAILDGDIASALAKKPILNSSFSTDRKCAALEEIIGIELNTGYGQKLDEHSKYMGGSTDTVLKIHEYKTAWYTLTGPLRVGALLAGGYNSQLHALTNYGMAVGMAFQIKDDMMGVLSPEALKKAKNDITEGKLTMPVAQLYSCGAPEQIAAVRGYMGKQLSSQDVEHITKILMESGALDKCNALMESYASRAKTALEGAQLNNSEFLECLADFVISRTR